jgi:hypothetical protein
MLQINSVLLSISILLLAAAEFPALSTKDTEEWEIEPDPTVACTGESCDHGRH